MSEPDQRQVIPAGDQTTLDYLFPIVDLLIERGLVPVDEVTDHGFRPAPDAWRCPLRGVITPEDWAAVNERFVVPRTIVYIREAWVGGGTITDNLNYVDIIGARDPQEPPNVGHDLQWDRRAR